MAFSSTATPSTSRFPPLDPSFFGQAESSTSSPASHPNPAHHPLASTSSSTSSASSSNNSHTYPGDRLLHQLIPPASSPGPPPSPRRHTGGVLLSRVRARSQIPQDRDRYRSEDEEDDDGQDDTGQSLPGSKSLGSLTGLWAVGGGGVGGGGAGGKDRTEYDLSSSMTSQGEDRGGFDSANNS